MINSELIFYSLAISILLVAFTFNIIIGIHIIALVKRNKERMNEHSLAVHKSLLSIKRALVLQAFFIKNK